MGTATASKLTDLCILAEKYGTDKLGFYTPIYDLLLSGRRESVSRVLEVGIGSTESMRHVPNYKPGASLRMWRDYFPKAIIYGIDINADAVVAAIELENRIVCFCSDSISMAPGPRSLRFDLIVDDGDHTARSQLETFRNLSPLLAPGGLYIIEDVDHPVLLDVEHSYFSHIKKNATGRAILIRQEALNAV